MESWVVTKEESGLKLLEFLSKKFPSLSNRSLKRAIEQNCCQVNQRTERFASFILGFGDKVSLNLKTSVRQESFTFEPNRVLFNDLDLLVYNKPPGIASDSKELLQVLQKQYGDLILSHRLDRDTTGALIFAKKRAVYDKICILFHNHLVKKKYLALVSGVPKKISGKIDNFLGPKHRYEGQTIYGEVAEKQGGAHAITEWELKEQNGKLAILLCTPITGRTHQIRVHLSQLGYPIVGDYQYGYKQLGKSYPSRYFLHAESLNFPHPISGEPVYVKAPIPEDFLQQYNNPLT